MAAINNSHPAAAHALFDAITPNGCPCAQDIHLRQKEKGKRQKERQRLALSFHFYLLPFPFAFLKLFSSLLRRGHAALLRLAAVERASSGEVWHPASRVARRLTRFV